ncbi:MAG TPA: guanylate kinase [Steroidobacteraceae bacterium]|nr:guanylate kinase [Steroidobacteraceae bacterium]
MTQGHSHPQGRLLVITAPSGAGKTSLVNALIERNPRLKVSISYTTRKARPHELADREYHFIDRAQFEQMQRAGAFLEHAQVFDHYYGTGRDAVQQLLQTGTDVVLEIDWQGARQVRAAMPDCISIFILPPSRSALQERLEKRQSDSAEVIARRLRDAVGDMSHYREFDYVVVNDHFERALADLERIVAGDGGSLRADRPGLQPLIAHLLTP